MDWMSNLFIALLLTDITGTLFFLIGLLFRTKWMKHDTSFLRFMVVATWYAYLIPFVYMAFCMGAALDVGSNVNLFYNTPFTNRAFSALGLLWLILCLALLGYHLYRRGRWMAVCRGNIPEEDERIAHRFREICAGLGIAGKVSLYRNDSVDIPCITYWHGPAVILPLDRYTEKEIDVILYHELCHYLEGDLRLKYWSFAVVLIHVFNPAAHILLKQMDLICEECCDRRACEQGAEAFSTGEYFRVIFQLLLTEGKRERYQLFALVDSPSNYERRVRYMSEYRKCGGMKKGMAMALASCFLLGSSMTALAAGEELSDAYIETVENINEKEAEAAALSEDQQALEELCRAYDLDPNKVIMMGDDSIETCSSTFTLDWNVPADRTIMSSGFTESVGNEVSILVSADPDDMTYQTGLKDPDQIMHYVEGEGVISHTFSIEIKGRYYFFVTNLSETEELHIEAFVVK